MANRHLSRSIVLQTLFEWDFEPGKKKANEVGDILDRNVLEFAPGIDEVNFSQKLLEEVTRKKKIIDEIIEKAAPEWPVDKISCIDRNVLRIGLAELIFGDRDQVPPKVAINEAIELAKSFGGENSGRFVNGVLGAVYKEIGEPGKQDVSKRKQNEKGEDIPVENKGGAVVYSIDSEGTIRLAMVHDVFGYWTLSKSSIAPDETPEQGTIRALKKETSLDVSIVDKLGENEYIAHHPEKGEIKKHVYYFLAKSDYVPVKLVSDSGGLDDCKWFDLADITDLKLYDDVTEMIGRSIEIINSKQ